MVSQTSKECFFKIKESGMLRKNQLRIYRLLTYMENGATMTEILNGLGWKSNQSGRFSELTKMGVIEVIRKEKCSETGNTVGVYAVTGKMPIKPKKKESTLFKIQGVIFDTEDFYRFDWSVETQTNLSMEYCKSVHKATIYLNNGTCLDFPFVTEKELKRVFEIRNV